MLYRGVINVCITKNSFSANLYLIILYHLFRFVIILNMSFWFPKNCYPLIQLPLFILYVSWYCCWCCFVQLFCFVLFFFSRSKNALPSGKNRGHTSSLTSNNDHLTTKFDIVHPFVFQLFCGKTYVHYSWYQYSGLSKLRQTGCKSTSFRFFSYNVSLKREERNLK